MNKENIAKSVLLPGDPRRAEYISKNYLAGSVPFKGLRGISGFTGTYMGRKVSVMGSGMGIPSVSLCASTLYECYDVQNIIRIGTCGTARDDVNIGDILIAEGCSTTSGINRRLFSGSLFCPIADFELLRTAIASAKENGLAVKVGNLISTDLFYDIADNDSGKLWWKFGILGVEMEGAGLYTTALRYGRRALMICTVSDSIITREGMSPELRETSLHEMISLGLNTIHHFCD